MALREETAAGADAELASSAAVSSATVSRGGWLLPVALPIAAALVLAGCGPTLYAIAGEAAERRFDEARELGAEQYAPHEFSLAREHLEKSKREAAEADYEDAIRLAETAESQATRAIAESRKAHRGGPR